MQKEQIVGTVYLSFWLSGEFFTYTVGIFTDETQLGEFVSWINETFTDVEFSVEVDYDRLDDMDFFKDGVTEMLTNLKEIQLK